MTKEDPSILLLLVLAAHEVELDYEKMSELSCKLPDINQQSTSLELRANTYSLVELAKQLRRFRPSNRQEPFSTSQRTQEHLLFRSSEERSIAGDRPSSSASTSPDPESASEPSLESSSSAHRNLPVSSAVNCVGRNFIDRRLLAQPPSPSSPSTATSRHFSETPIHPAYYFHSCRSRGHIIRNARLAPESATSTTGNGNRNIPRADGNHQSRVQNRRGSRRNKRNRKGATPAFNWREIASDPEGSYQSDSSSVSGRVWIAGKDSADDVNPAWACLSTWSLVPSKERDDDSTSVGGGVWVEI
ncbi:hypothetical protein MPDQ_001085 [Monascus purpureus]|uniref:Uncharacterized protein n=1 Tax=Monascus purpureus TaxID=5098 RepID=A0A507QSI8_MONPU|nr:hypothetical protein MPDQ_001085 [Monascus purpureus]